MGEGLGTLDGRHRNRILAALPHDEYARIEPRLERVILEIRAVLIDVNAPIEYVWFPETFVGSIIGLMSDGTAVETATVGHEGMIGLPVFHGTDRTTTQAFCQIPGVGFRLPADTFREAVAVGPTMTLLMHRYSQALLTLVGQTSACNRLHTMKQRCARWLLHCHDRVGSSEGVKEFPLTQSFLSQMLGVRRATVTEAMGALQDAGAVAYQMGRIRVVDRARLEELACECYAVVHSEFERLLPGAGVGPTGVRNPLEDVKSSEDGKSTAGEPIPEEEKVDREA